MPDKHLQKITRGSLGEEVFLWSHHSHLPLSYKSWDPFQWRHYPDIIYFHGNEGGLEVEGILNTCTILHFPYQTEGELRTSGGTE